MIHERMRLLRIFCLAFIILLNGLLVEGQPMPLELMLGNKSGSVNFLTIRNFSPNSRLGFFNNNTIRFDYKDAAKNSFSLQNLVYVKIFKNIRVAGGVSYNSGGLMPTAGLQYVYSSKKLFFLMVPQVRININPSYSILTILQYKQEINDRIKLVGKVQLNSSFNAAGNIRSNQWMRIGLDIKGTQFGLAVNLDEKGPDPSVESNFGVYLRKEIL